MIEFYVSFLEFKSNIRVCVLYKHDVLNCYPGQIKTLIYWKISNENYTGTLIIIINAGYLNTYFFYNV